MNLLPIFGGGGGYTPPQQPASSTETSKDASTDTGPAAAPPSQPSDTAAPAPASGTTDSATDSQTKPTDQQSEAAKASLIAPDGPSSTAQSVVEAQLTAPEDSTPSEADARRYAEAAQQRQQFELLLNAISVPTDTAQPIAAPAEQAAEGDTATDGTPV